VCYWDVTPCRRFENPVDSIFRVQIMSRPGEIGRLRKIEQMAKVWVALIGDGGHEVGGRVPPPAISPSLWPFSSYETIFFLLSIYVRW
jgi:hypothetical protein